MTAEQYEFQALSSSVAEMKKPMSPGELFRARYKDGYLIMEEVGDLPGMHKRRSIDYMTFGIWQSTGYELQAFEQKVSRSDWLRELKDFSKSDAIIKNVDRFWLYAAKGVAKKEEIPANWGWLEFGEQKITVKKGAPLLRQYEDTFTRSGIARMLHAHQRWVSQYARSIATDMVSDRIKHADQMADRRLQSAKEELELSQKAAQRILDAVGLNQFEVLYRSGSYELPKWGAFAKKSQHMASLKGVHANLERMTKQVKETLDKMSAISEKEPA